MQSRESVWHIPTMIGQAHVRMALRLASAFVDGLIAAREFATIAREMSRDSTETIPATDIAPLFAPPSAARDVSFEATMAAALHFIEPRGTLATAARSPATIDEGANRIRLTISAAC